MWDDHDQVRANWAKPNIILEHLERYHYVMMLDSDAYVMDPSLTIESLVEVYMKNFSIIVPNNCLAGTEGSFQSWQCWSKGLNIGAMIVKRTGTSPLPLTPRTTHLLTHLSTHRPMHTQMHPWR